MVYVLVVMAWMGGYVSGVGAVTFHEFDGERACTAARDVLIDEAKKWSVGNNIRAFCVSKGSH